jgi:hypothetical protein
MLNGAAVFQVGGDAGGAEGMAADGGIKVAGFGSHLCHPPGIDAVHWPIGSHPFAVNSANPSLYAFGTLWVVKASIGGAEDDTLVTPRPFRR